VEAFLERCCSARRRAVETWGRWGSRGGWGWGFLRPLGLEANRCDGEKPAKGDRST